MTYSLVCLLVIIVLQLLQIIANKQKYSVAGYIKGKKKKLQENNFLFLNQQDSNYGIKKKDLNSTHRRKMC